MVQVLLGGQVRNAFQQMARQQAAQGPLHLQHTSQDNTQPPQQQQQQTGGQQQSVQATPSLSSGTPSQLLDPITQVIWTPKIG